MNECIHIYMYIIHTHPLFISIYMFPPTYANKIRRPAMWKGLIMLMKKQKTPPTIFNFLIKSNIISDILNLHSLCRARSYVNNERRV